MSKVVAFKEDYIVDVSGSYIVTTEQIMDLKSCLINSGVVHPTYINNITRELLWTLITQYGLGGGIDCSMSLIYSEQTPSTAHCNICDNWYLVKNNQEFL